MKHKRRCPFSIVVLASVTHQNIVRAIAVDASDLVDMAVCIIDDDFLAVTKVNVIDILLLLPTLSTTQ